MVNDARPLAQIRKEIEALLASLCTEHQREMFRLMYPKGLIGKPRSVHLTALRQVNSAIMKNVTDPDATAEIEAAHKATKDRQSLPDHGSW